MVTRESQPWLLLVSGEVFYGKKKKKLTRLALHTGVREMHGFFLRWLTEESKWHFFN